MNYKAWFINTDNFGIELTTTNVGQFFDEFKQDQVMIFSDFEPAKKYLMAKIDRKIRHLLAAKMNIEFLNRSALNRTDDMI